MYAFFDIGATKTRISVSRDGIAFMGEPQVVETPSEFEELVQLGVATVKKLVPNESVTAVVAGIAGPIDQENGTLAASTNIGKGTWVGKPIKSGFEQAFGAPVFIQNDAALVGLGEMYHGAGETSGIGVYVTVSTGVGGARYVDGSIDRAVFGFEPGHQIIDAGKALCSDCLGPRLEDYISGRSTELRLGKKPYDIPQDDPLWEQYAYFLAVGLTNISAHWSPHVIVLGGSMMIGDPKIELERVSEHLQELLKIFPHVPELRSAKLGDIGGLYGAMEYAKQQFAV